MEQQILFLINRQWTCPALDLFMGAITNFALWMIPLALIAGALFIFGGFRGRAAVVSVLLVVAIGDGLIAGWLKEKVGRPRPHEVLADVRMVALHHTKIRAEALFRDAKVTLSRPKLGEIPVGNSFPSAHTLDNFAVATVLWAFYRKRASFYWVIAGLVAYSRIYTGSHWPSDVAVSIFMGIGIALICLASFEWLWRRLAPRIAPALAGRHPSLFELEPAGQKPSEVSIAR